MKRYRNVVELESPLAISARRATGHSLEARRHIPGTTLRGALAQAFQDEGGKPRDAEFEALFLQGKVRIGDQRPFGERPWPCSARECADEPAPSDHSPVDLLLQKGAHVPMIPHCTFRQAGSKDQSCGAKRRPLEGYYQVTRRGYADIEVKMRRMAHTQIHPQFLRAMTGQFHTSTVLPEELRLEGFFWAHEDAAVHLEVLVGKEKTLRVGRGRTRGQGQVRLRLEPESPGQAADLRRQIEEFNQEAQRVYPQFRGKVLFSCSLLSGAILLDEWLMARGTVAASDVAPDVNSKTARYERLASFLQTEPLAGWNAGAGFPRGEVTMVAPGSCYLFGREVTETEREAEYTRLAEDLVKAEEAGIGERRAEGLGEVAFCERIHWEKAAQEGR